MHHYLVALALGPGEGGLEMKARNRDSEAPSIGALEGVVALHVSDGRAQDAEARVGVYIAGSEQGLFAHDTFSVDLAVFAHRIVDQPVAKEELRRFVPLVRKLHPIREHEGAVRRFGPGQREAGPDVDGNTFGKNRKMHGRREGGGESSLDTCWCTDMRPVGFHSHPRPPEG